ncbi:MAG: hypothetical protein ABSG93_07560 [Solirubrobacteraceae bacterium]|jgi:hypothetical protein
MATLYTKEGRPLRQDGDDLFARSGTHVARLRGKKAYDPSGQYVGTLVGNRLVYRAIDSASLGPVFATRLRAGTASAGAVGAAVLGDEPPIPD